MSMIDWAEREVKIACERERYNAKNCDDWGYGVACYEIALKAFKCLCGDWHSGMSISITKSILNRLIDGRPLTPIEDTDDIWDLCSWNGRNGEKVYQCTRMSLLFKNVCPDGTVTYTDIDRTRCYGKTNPNVLYHSGLVDRLINKIWPITMPYCPDSMIKVACEDFLVDRRNEDFDTVGIYYAVKPDGERVDIKRYFKCDDWLDDDWVEISQEDYAARYTASLDREQNESLKGGF